MTNVIVIVAQPGLRRTSLVKQMVGNKKTTWLNDRQGFSPKDILSQLTPDDDFLVVDDVVTTSKVLRLYRAANEIETTATIVIISNDI